MECNHLKEYERGPPQEDSCEIWYGRTHGRMDGRTHDGQNAMTIARWPLANGAKNHVRLTIQRMHERQISCSLNSS